jgi:hypothetical protein
VIEREKKRKREEKERETPQEDEIMRANELEMRETKI